MECFWVLGQRLDFFAVGETTGGRYSFFHVFIPAGPPGTGLGLALRATSTQHRR
jgi:hypothetical protein